MVARAYTRGTMRCPACGHENLPGEDVCTNCGTDLWDVERIRPDDDLGSHLFDAPLDALRPHPPTTIGPHEPADQAVARLKAEGVDCLLVTEDGQLVGIFTERDAILKLGGHAAGELQVGDLMTSDPVVLRGGDSLAVAVNKMAAGGFRHIPVVEDGRPVGVVTAADVFRYLDRFLA
jgi:CBS domain-containing protein